MCLEMLWSVYMTHKSKSVIYVHISLPIQLDFNFHVVMNLYIYGSCLYIALGVKRYFWSDKTTF